MGISTYDSIQVLAIPVQEIKKCSQYLSLDFYDNFSAKHEVRNFVKEVCSKYALSLNDLIKVIRSNTESFSPKVLEYIQAISDKQLKSFVKDVIYTTNSFGYGPSREFRGGWKALLRNAPEPKRKKKISLSLLFKVKNSIIKKEYFFYDKDFVNPLTLDKKEIPEHINTEWDNELDKEIYIKMLKKYSEEERRGKPVIEASEVDATTREKVKIDLGAK